MCCLSYLATRYLPLTLLTAHDVLIGLLYNAAKIARVDGSTRVLDSV